VSAPRPAVFFLSDYGLSDEFVGVVHAVLLRLVPDLVVVDLTHGIPAFDVRAGAESLVRAVPHLGPGVVLAVVDPGVGSGRRGVAVRAADGRWFVGPDNGLVVAAAEASGGVAAVRALGKPEGAPATFDGRDVFAPAAAALATAVATAAEPAAVGDEVDPASLVRFPPLEVSRVWEAGRVVLRAPVTWVDGFGNVQLAVAEGDGPPAEAGKVAIRAGSAAGTGAAQQLVARRVRAFGDLEDGELGVLADANGRVTIVVREGSAADATGLVAGGVAELVW
jgi:S-adenosyl-L-methionine hydrolase (adenosine-forming)